MSIKTISMLSFSLFLCFVPSLCRADERLFTYVYETNVLPQGRAEFEQSITNQSGKKDGEYSQWNFRSEIEYGVTKNYMTALYLNLDATRSERVTGIEDTNNTEFKGFSSENIYQILNPNLDPIGLAAYLEYTTDGVDHELESKLLLSKPVTSSLTLAFNAVYEAESEEEEGFHSREGTLEFIGGASYKVSSEWSTGVEFRNKSAYPDGLNVSGQEYNSWSIGPNVHYGSPVWWGTFTILPQVWGNGDDSNGSRQLVHEEALGARLIFGRSL